MDEPLPPVSPTGTPVVPPKFVPVALAVLAAAGAVLALAPSHTLAFRAAAVVLGTLGPLLGVASPGLRK